MADEVLTSIVIVDEDTVYHVYRDGKLQVSESYEYVGRERVWGPLLAPLGIDVSRMELDESWEDERGGEPVPEDLAELEGHLLSTC